VGDVLPVVLTKLNVRAWMAPVLTFSGVEEQPVSARMPAARIRSGVNFISR
jgi:hypothetical protein